MTELTQSRGRSSDCTSVRDIKESAQARVIERGGDGMCAYLLHGNGGKNVVSARNSADGCRNEEFGICNKDAHSKGALY